MHRLPPLTPPYQGGGLKAFSPYQGGGCFSNELGAVPLLDKEGLGAVDKRFQLLLLNTKRRPTTTTSLSIRINHFKIRRSQFSNKLNLTSI